MCDTTRRPKKQDGNFSTRLSQKRSNFLQIKFSIRVSQCVLWTRTTSILKYRKLPFFHQVDVYFIYLFSFNSTFSLDSVPARIPKRIYVEYEYTEISIPPLNPFSSVRLVKNFSTRWALILREIFLANF